MSDLQDDYRATGWGRCDACSLPRPIRYSGGHGAWFCRTCWAREVVVLEDGCIGGHSPSLASCVLGSDWP